MIEWFKKTMHKLFNGIKTGFNYIKKYSVIAFNYIKKYSVIGFNYFKKHYVKIGFYVLAFILFINAILMSLYLLNRNYDFRILNKLYISAILPDQDITSTMKTGIIKIEEIDYQEIDVNDKVVFCCDYGLDNNWVQEVVDINRDVKLLETTYDGVVTTNVNEDEIHGVYIKEANFFGTLYYTSSFPRGFVLLMISQVILLYTYHHILIKRRLDGVFAKQKIAESEEENENS